MNLFRKAGKEMSVITPLNSVFLMFCLAGGVFAQPAITAKGIVNAASYISPDLPAGSIAQGSIFTIFGNNFGPTTGVKASSFPLLTSLAGLSVKISQGAGSWDAIPLFVNATQINAIMPSSTPLGLVSVTVTSATPKATSAPVSVTVVKSSLGIFTAKSSGLGPGILQNFISTAEQPLNSTLKTAKPRQVVTLWATGPWTG